MDAGRYVRPPTTYDWARRRRCRPLAGAFTSHTASISRYIMPSDLVRLHVRYSAPSARAFVADPCPLPRRTSASPTRRGIRIGKTSVQRPAAIPLTLFNAALKSSSLAVFKSVGLKLGTHYPYPRAVFTDRLYGP